MYLFYIPISLISVGGLLISVWMIIDAAIVMISNFQQLESDDCNMKSILRAIGEVKGAIFASTFTSVAAFLPFLFTTGISKALFGDLAKIIMIVLLTSAISAIFVLPTFISFPLREKKGVLFAVSGAVRNKLTLTYHKILDILLNRYKLSLLLMTVMLFITSVGTVLLISNMRREILSNPKSKGIQIGVEKKADKPATKASLELAKVFKQKYQSHIKTTIVNLFDENFSNIQLIFDTDNLEGIMEEMDEYGKAYQGFNLYINPRQEATMPLETMADFYFVPQGPDHLELIKISEKVANFLKNHEKVRFTRTLPLTQPVENIMVKPKWDYLSLMPGIHTGELASVFEGKLFRKPLFHWEKEGEIIPVEFKLESQKEKSISMEQLANIQFPYGTQTLPISTFLTIKKETDFNSIMYATGMRSYWIYGSLKRQWSAYGKEKHVNALLQEIRKEVVFPEGYSIKEMQLPIEGKAEGAFNTLLDCLILALVLIFLTLTFYFNSFYLPFIALTPLLFGIPGAVFSLWIANVPLNINALLAMMLLSGLAVNNSILIIEFMKLQSNKIPLVERLKIACHKRLIPIVVTSLTTIGGVLPMAIALGPGMNVLQSFGISLFGGMLCSTLASIFGLPLLLLLGSSVASKE